MILRCGCYDQADDIVFGPRHQCTTRSALSTPDPEPHPHEAPSDPLYHHVLGEDETHD
jgi:hypothetical protein